MLVAWVLMEGKLRPLRMLLLLLMLLQEPKLYAREIFFAILFSSLVKKLWVKKGTTWIEMIR